MLGLEHEVVAGQGREEVGNPPGRSSVPLALCYLLAEVTLPVGKIVIGVDDRPSVVIEVVSQAPDLSGRPLRSRCQRLRTREVEATEHIDDQQGR